MRAGDHLQRGRYDIGQRRGVQTYLPILLHPGPNLFVVNLHHLLGRKVGLKNAVITLSPAMRMQQELQWLTLSDQSHLQVRP